MSTSSINITNKEFKVLDSGLIRVVDTMGSDEAIVQAARVSYGTGTKKISEDRGLIRYLMRHHHTTPFEMCEIKFHLRVPMDVWRQWIRHRTANVNEYSTRYSIAIDSAHKTKPTEWRLQNPSNKQGSTGFLDLDKGREFSQKEIELHDFARNIYNERLEAGVAREQARKDLPLSTYTEAYWKIDLHNLFHFLELRMNELAQYEIRMYANIIGNEIVSKWCPLAWEAFIDYRLNSVTFSNTELKIVKLIIQGKFEEAINILNENKFLVYSDGKVKRNRELEEFAKKLLILDLEIPWL